MRHISDFKPDYMTNHRIFITNNNPINFVLRYIFHLNNARYYTKIILLLILLTML